MANHKVNGIVEAQPEGHTLHLRQKAQVSEQVVIKDVEKGKNGCNDREYDALDILAFDNGLLSDALDKPDCACTNQTCPY